MPYGVLILLCAIVSAATATLIGAAFMMFARRQAKKLQPKEAPLQQEVVPQQVAAPQQSYPRTTTACAPTGEEPTSERPNGEDVPASARNSAYEAQYAALAAAERRASLDADVDDDTSDADVDDDTDYARSGYTPTCRVRTPTWVEVEGGGGGGGGPPAGGAVAAARPVSASQGSQRASFTAAPLSPLAPAVRPMSASQGSQRASFTAAPLSPLAPAVRPMSASQGSQRTSFTAAAQRPLAPTDTISVGGGTIWASEHRGTAPRRPSMRRALTPGQVKASLMADIEHTCSRRESELSPATERSELTNETMRVLYGVIGFNAPERKISGDQHPGATRYGMQQREDAELNDSVGITSADSD